MKQIYHLPVNVKIDADDPNALIKRIAETIHDAVTKIVNESGLEDHVKFLDVEYSIYIQAKKGDFAEEQCKQEGEHA